MVTKLKKKKKTQKNHNGTSCCSTTPNEYDETTTVIILILSSSLVQSTMKTCAYIFNDTHTHIHAYTSLNTRFYPPHSRYYFLREKKYHNCERPCVLYRKNVINGFHACFVPSNLFVTLSKKANLLSLHNY